MEFIRTLLETVDTYPTSFETGEDFMDYVYNTFGKRQSYVEMQGGDTWLAEINGHSQIGGATYDGESKMVTWVDHEMEPIPELNPNHQELN